ATPPSITSLVPVISTVGVARIDRGPPPATATGRLSPAANVPPVNGENGVTTASGAAVAAAPLADARSFTSPPPGPWPAMTSSRPSPSASTTPTRTPPVIPGNTSRLENEAVSLPLNTLTPPPPDPWPATTSAYPSPVTSPTARWTPDRSLGSKAK